LIHFYKRIENMCHLKLSMNWRKLLSPISAMRLDITLKCGQSFRWKLVKNEKDVYIGVLKHNLYLLTQNDNEILYQCISNPDIEDAEEVLKDYFQLSVDLSSLYQEWSKNDPIFERISNSYPGVRILRQDPLENVFSFICSANNNISRISGMVEKMCVEWGEVVGEYDSIKYYSFPSLEHLSKQEVEVRLRELGFGYRAKYIQKSAKQILENGGVPWLYSHRNMTYHQARQSLLKLSGVGPKVADCILLMSMDQTDAVPVDTHMFNIAKEYLPHLSEYKSVTDKVYTEIGNHFRGLYGQYAGWAHSVLFSADLKHLKSTLNTEDKSIKSESKTQSKSIKEERWIIKVEESEARQVSIHSIKRELPAYFKNVKPKHIKVIKTEKADET